MIGLNSAAFIIRTLKPNAIKHGKFYAKKSHLVCKEYELGKSEYAAAVLVQVFIQSLA